jgi:hypothetical protein|tara:strand:+ start:417 stop:605 length:189 start_codon:yes stop_codon:yes gene_type:complete
MGNYTKKIQWLKETHRQIDKNITLLEKVQPNNNQIAELKKKKLFYKDEITRLEKLEEGILNE